MNQILEEVRVLQNKLKSDHLNYELKLNNAKMVCGSSTADVINQIEAKKQSLDDHSESVLKSYNKGAIDMTVFVQVKSSDNEIVQFLSSIFFSEFSANFAFLLKEAVVLDCIFLPFIHLFLAMTLTMCTYSSNYF
jgi:hypothetical protein